MKKIVLPILLLSLLISCSSGSEDPAPPNMTSNDNEAPQISIGSFPDLIEILSSFQVNVTDASSVTTRIFIDDDLVTETTNKNINFDIDPFEYSVGNRILRVTATDANNNEESISIPFELKKLLFVLPNPISDNAYPSADQFLSVNFSDGSLYTSKKLETDEDGTIYANDDFERQKFIVSLYWSTNTTNVNFHNIYSFTDIEPATVVLSSSERFNIFNTGSLPASIPVLLELPDFVNPKIYGYNGRLDSFGGPPSYLFNYNSNAPEEFFLYDFPDFGNPQVDYKFTLITDLQITSYSTADLSLPNEFTSLVLPDQTDFSLIIEGYQTEADFSENRYHRILEVYAQTIATSSIDVPLFPSLFETYNLVYSTTLDNKRKFSIKQSNLDTPINIDATISVTESGQNIMIEGSHDYSRRVFRFGFTAPNTFSNTFEWNFHQKEAASIEEPLENFEIPQEVMTLFDERLVLPKPSQQTNDFYILDLEVYDFTGTVIYENMMFGSSYNQNEGGDVSWLTYNLKN